MSKQTKQSKKEIDQQRVCQELCEARCCRYVTVQIDAPRVKADFDEIAWWLAHENVSVYFYGRRWHVEMQTRCKHLAPDNLCGAYGARPAVCRDYAAEECEYPERPRHDLQFNTREEFEGWWEKKQDRARRRRRGRAANRD
jgi:Fe-S-cluster containining protein